MMLKMHLQKLIKKMNLYSQKKKEKEIIRNSIEQLKIKNPLNKKVIYNGYGYQNLHLNLKK